MLQPKLIPESLAKHIPSLYETEDIPEEEKEFKTKLFLLPGQMTWYIAEYDQEKNLGFAYVVNGDIKEWGYVDLDELQEINNKYYPMPMIERDLYFSPIKFKDLEIGD